MSMTDFGWCVMKSGERVSDFFPFYSDCLAFVSNNNVARPFSICHYGDFGGGPYCFRAYTFKPEKD